MKPAAPNVILLTVDSLRADCVEAGLTPSLARFAGEAVVFASAFSQGPYTNMSMPSLFTGRYPSQLAPIEVHGVYGVSVRGAPTLATLLAAAGYHTLGFHSNPFLSRVFGFDRGFAEFYDDLLLDGARLPAHWKLLLNRVHRLGRSTPFLPAAALNRVVVAGLERAREPFFLWVHYMDPHGPYAAGGWGPLGKLRAERLWRKATRRPEEISGPEHDQLWAGYRRRIASLDEHLGALFAEFTRRGLWENSLVVVTADHGDEFGEHGGYTHTHKLYDELIHVPLVVRAPGAASRRVEEVVELVQVVPTVLGEAGVPLPEGLAGDSLEPRRAGAPTGASGASLSEGELIPNYIGCLREKNWKFIGEERSGREELYELGADPDERRNVIAAHPQVADRLREKWFERRRGGVHAARAQKLSAADEALVEARLRDLGYL